MKKHFPYLILFSALFISVTGSVFSIYGLGKLFGGHQVGATILAFAFEFGNIITAASLKFYWKYLPNVLKYPLILIVIILTVLTSMGIYGYLSDGYQKTALKDEIISKRSNLIKIKKEIYDNRVVDNKKEIETLNSNLQELSKGYNQNTQSQQMIKGQVVTNVIVGNKKGLEKQMDLLNLRKYKLDSLNSKFHDSIQTLELKIIEIENSNESASELGPLKYLSQLLNKPMNQIVNWLIILIVIVFQPLALLLILTAMFAFKNNHYIMRGSKKKSEPTFDFKGFVEKVKNKFKKSQPIPPIIEKPKRIRKQPKVQPDETIIEVHSNEEIPTEEVIPERNIETSELADKPNPKPRKKRRVIDNNLTPQIADHIAASLGNKKKV